MKKMIAFIIDFARKMLVSKREFKRRLVLIAIVLISHVPLQASAVLVLSDSTMLSGNQWANSYTLIAEAEDAPVEEFTIYFNPSLYSNLTLVSLPLGWDAVVVQPDGSLPADGFFDALALNAALNPGETLSGFVVSFDYVGGGIPPRQAFDIVDPLTFQTIASGLTTVESVPEPRTLALLLPGVGLLVLFSRRRPMLERNALVQPMQF